MRKIDRKTEEEKLALIKRIQDMSRHGVRINEACHEIGISHGTYHFWVQDLKKKAVAVDNEGSSKVRKRPIRKCLMFGCDTNVISPDKICANHLKKRGLCWNE